MFKILKFIYLKQLIFNIVLLNISFFPTRSLSFLGCEITTHPWPWPRRVPAPLQAPAEPSWFRGSWPWLRETRPPLEGQWNLRIQMSLRNGIPFHSSFFLIFFLDNCKHTYFWRPENHERCPNVSTKFAGVQAVLSSRSAPVSRLIAAWLTSDGPKGSCRM